MATPMFDDYGIENQAIDRRRAMAQALMQTQAPQGRMVGRVFVGANPLEHLAAGLKQYSGRKDLEQADVDQKALGQQYQARGAADAQKYVDLLRGKESQQFAQPVPNDEEGNAMPPAQSAAVPANPAQAMAFALQSHNPAIQAAGGAQLKEMTASPKWEKAERPKADGSKETGFVNTSSRDPWSTFQLGGTAPVKREFVNGQGVNPYSGETQGAPIPKQLEPDSVVTRGGDGALVPNMPVVNAKAAVAAAGKPSVTSTVINAGPKAFEVELGKLDAKQLGDWRTSAETASNTLGVVQNLRAAEKQGAYSGAGADAKLAAARLVNGITGASPKGMVGSELYNSESKKLILDHIKSLGANPSNADREFIEKTVPQMATSAQARSAMADFMEGKAKSQIDLYQRADKHARENHGLGGFQAVKTPTATAPAAKTVVRTGTLNGRKVVEYSDGSTGYAD